jgi:3-hydroxyacyl-CoA dehydrogenase
VTPPPRTIGVIGAGTMGAGIAQLACLSGAQTLVHDAVPDALDPLPFARRHRMPNEAIALGENGETIGGVIVFVTDTGRAVAPGDLLVRRAAQLVPSQLAAIT